MKHTLLILCVAASAAAQQPANCDSVVGAARVDSVPSAIFISVRSSDVAVDPDYATRIALNVGAGFVPPRPLRLSVFGAAPALRVLRASSDTAPTLRAPNITGVYELTVAWGDSIPRVRVARTSLIAGFDNAALDAIRAATLVQGLFAPPNGQSAARINIRFSTDSIVGAKRIISGSFPRMPVIDAVPIDTNPAIPFPDSARAFGLTGGNVVLRFIVGRDGQPEPGTTEAVRASDLVFLRAAVDGLRTQRFRPATIHGCPVAQVVDYSISFFAPEPPRH
jgi:hypothetical protein